MSVLLLQIPQTSCECAFEHFGVHKMSRSQPHFNSAFEDNVIEYADFHRKLFCWSLLFTLNLETLLFLLVLAVMTCYKAAQFAPKYIVL